jgi:hypothetical protein
MRFDLYKTYFSIMSWICPKCERTLRMQNQWHDCVTVSIDTLFEDKRQDLIMIFDQLLSNVALWADVSASATTNCIVFTKPETFLVVRPMKNALDLKFYLPEHYQEFPIHKSCEYGKKFEHHIRIASFEELNNRVYEFIKMAYDR